MHALRNAGEVLHPRSTVRFTAFCMSRWCWLLSSAPRASPHTSCACSSSHPSSASIFDLLSSQHFTSRPLHVAMCANKVASVDVMRHVCATSRRHLLFRFDWNRSRSTIPVCPIKRPFRKGGKAGWEREAGGCGCLPHGNKAKYLHQSHTHEHVVVVTKRRGTPSWPVSRHWLNVVSPTPPGCSCSSNPSDSARFGSCGHVQEAR